MLTLAFIATFAAGAGAMFLVLWAVVSWIATAGDDLAA